MFTLVAQEPFSCCLFAWVDEDFVFTFRLIGGSGCASKGQGTNKSVIQNTYIHAYTLPDIIWHLFMLNYMQIVIHLLSTYITMRVSVQKHNHLKQCNQVDAAGLWLLLALYMYAYIHIWLYIHAFMRLHISVFLPSIINILTIANHIRDYYRQQRWAATKRQQQQLIYMYVCECGFVDFSMHLHQQQCLPQLPHIMNMNNHHQQIVSCGCCHIRR